MPSMGKILGQALIYFWIAVLSVPANAEDKASVYVNGKILTVDDMFTTAEAFSVQGGKFVRVGSTEDVMKTAGPDAEIIDLRGKTVIPGLIDNHNHFIRGAQHWKSLVRLDGVETRAKAKQMIAEKAKSLAPGEWLLILGGWHKQQFLDENRGFSLKELDDLSPDNPVFIHMQYKDAFVNSAFYKAVGIPLVQKEAVEYQRHPILGNPLPALVQRDQNGHVTSLIEGGLMMVMQVAAVIPPVPHETGVAAFREAQEFYHSLGMTGVYDPAGALINPGAYAAIEDLHRKSELTLRTYRTHWIQAYNAPTLDVAIKSIEKAGPFLNGDNFYDLIGVGEAIYVPIHDGVGEEPEFNEASDLAVEGIFSASLQRGFPLHIHAVNSSTLSYYLDFLEKMEQQYTIYPGQITFTHAEGANSAILERMKNLGATLQIRSASIMRSKDSLMETSNGETLGQPLLRLINDSGVSWGLGSDGTKAGQINPMNTLAWAVTGKALNGDMILEEDQLLSREEALIAHTRSNAKLVFRGDLLGQIRSGFLADFVVLDRDYLTVPEQEIRSIQPVLTVVSGEVVYEK